MLPQPRSLTPTALRKAKIWVRTPAVVAICVGFVLVVMSHWARVAHDLNTRSPGLVALTCGLLAYAIYQRLVNQMFRAMISTALFLVVLLMLHEQIARPGAVGEWRPADTFGMLLALGALGLAAYHEKQLTAALRELAKVQSALSTRYLGKFPHFLRTIVDELGRAEDEIVIFCDVPAYGYYSDPRAALAYRQVLESKALDGVRVELTCLDCDMRREYESEQFAESTWVRWQDDAHAKMRVAEFLNRHVDGRVEVSRDTFIKTLDKVHTTFLRDVFRNKAAEVAFDIPLYFWVVDGRTAVFAISALSDTEGWEEYGFITSDHALIQAFQEMRARYRRKNIAPAVLQSDASSTQPDAGAV